MTTKIIFSCRYQVFEKIKYLVSITCCLAVLSCSKEKWINTIPTIEKDISLCSNILNIPKDSIGAVTSILIRGNELIWSEGPNPIIKSYNLSNNKLSVLPVKAGRAEAEIINIHQLIGPPDTTQLFIVDNLQSKIIVFQKEQLSWKQKKVISYNNLSSVTLTNEGHLIGVSTNEARYSWINDSGPHLFGNYDDWDMDVETAWNFLQGMVLSYSDRLAWFAYYHAAYQIMNYHKGNTIYSCILEPSDYITNRGQAVLNKTSKLGFVSISSTNKELFALYDGKTLENYIQDRSKPYGQDIITMDWDGNIIGRYHSSIPIYAISSNGEQMLMAMIDKNGQFYFASFTL